MLSVPLPALKVLVWAFELILTKVSQNMAKQIDVDAKTTRLGAAVSAIIAKVNELKQAVLDAGISGAAEDALLAKIDQFSSSLETAAGTTTTPPPPGP